MTSIKETLTQLLNAWDMVPVGDHSVESIQRWLNSTKMKDAVTNARTALAQLDSADAVSSTTLARDWKTIEEQIASATPTELFSLFRDYLVMNSSPGDDLAPLYIARITAILSTGLLPDASRFEAVLKSLNYDGNDINSLTVGEIRRALP